MSMLFLSVHETALVRLGAVWDPRYRQSSFRADGESISESLVWDDLLDADSGNGSDTSTSVGADAANVASGSDGGRSASVFVNVASRYWQRSTQRVVFLVGRDADGQNVLGVGNCHTTTQRRARGTTTVELSTWTLFAQPVPGPTLVSALPTRNRSVMQRLLSEEDARSLPKALDRAFQEVIRVLAPDVDDALAQLPGFPRRLRPITLGELPTLDAQQSALRFFSARWRSLEPVVDSAGPTITALAYETLLTASIDQASSPPEVATDPDAMLRLESRPDPSADSETSPTSGTTTPPPSPPSARLTPQIQASEDETITDDAGAFLDWTSTGRARNGWFEFRAGDQQLLVKNINYTKKFETPTGADLVYVRSHPDSVVLVQYKLLTTNKDSTDFFFRDDRHLISQVLTMLKYSMPPESNPHGTDDYRLGGDIGFVKFVEPTLPKDNIDSRGIPYGRYHPAEGVQRMLGQPTKGPGGGPIHKVHEWRSLGGETFVKLVRDRWIGSVGADTDKLLKLLGLGVDDPLYLAVEEPLVDAENTAAP